MNFLSHFYFENGNPDDNMVMGVVLPDLVKNAQKERNLYPLKERFLFEADAHQFSILKGWERHVKVDAIFHSSAFFKKQTGILKPLLLPILEGSPVKPFFLAHIGLELILDHLLVVEGSINIDTFYEQLAKTDRQALKSFLENCAVDNTEIFFRFLDSFISSRYLLSYRKIENISYALNRICMRIWDTPFSDLQLSLLTEQLVTFREAIAKDYRAVFTGIDLLLKSDQLSKS